MSRRSRKKTTATHPGRRTTVQSKGGPVDGKERWLVLGICIFLGAITWLVFGQTLRHDFVNVDDTEYVLKNVEVARGLTIEGAAWAFTHFHASNWHPLTWISHMLDCQLFGLKPGGHHFTNVLLHMATALSLFLVLRQMTAALWRSAFVAAAFAIHPLRVESVAWVAERKDVLSGLFFVLTIGAYVRYMRRPSRAGYAAVTVLFALGLMCKPMLVTLPFVLLLLDYWPLNRFGQAGARNFLQVMRRLLLEKLPLFALATASCLITLFAQKGVIQPFASISFPFRAANAFISCAAYLRQLFWPSNLAALYPFPSGGIALPGILSLILLAGISLGIFVLRRRYPYLVTGWLWYLIMLGPVIGILQVGIQARADRYTYLPQIGLYVLLTWAVADLCERWRYTRLVPGILALILLPALAFTARLQASYWQDSQSLWTHAIACTADNAAAQTNLGQAYYEKRTLDKAIAHYERALQIEPDQVLAHSALGLALLDSGRPDESVTHLRKALEINPNFADAHYNLGNTFLQMGRASEALAQYYQTLAINPHDIEALNNTAWILATWPEATIRDGPKAVELAERADSFAHGESPVISATLAASYAEAGRAEAAVKTAERALRLATAQGNAARADSIRAQIALYQSGAAFRDRRHTRETR
jgi:tetratricopeptide (TPR) repeat protein